MNDQPQQPPQGRSEPQPPNVPQPHYASLPYGAPAQAFSGQSPYSSVPPDPNAMPPAQQKRSLRWLWITLSIVGVLLIGGCATCGILVNRGVGFFAQTAGPLLAAQQYYQAVQKQDYATAYSYLTSDATITSQNQTVPVISQQDYTQGAQVFDQNLGTVTNYTITHTGSDTTLLTIAVTRSKHTPYAVHFTLVQMGNTWKIKNMDGGF